ncbi:MAG: osmoprotectant transporter permease [Pseudomonadota bacterium]
MLFWVLWGIDAIVAAIFIYFFIIGLLDGSVSSFNLALWLAILVALAALLLGGYALHAAGKPRIAAALLSLLAVPGILAAMLSLVVIISPPNWN